MQPGGFECDSAVRGAAGQFMDIITESQEISADSPELAERSIWAILQATLACDIRVEEAASLIGCADIGMDYRLGSYEYTWHLDAVDFGLRSYAEEALLTIFEGMFVQCLANAATQTYTDLGIQSPQYWPYAVLIESWIEMCGSGERERSEFQWRSFAGAGSGSASGTDPFLLSELKEAGANGSEAVDALISAYHDHRVHCLVARAQNSPSATTLPG